MAAGRGLLSAVAVAVLTLAPLPASAAGDQQAGISVTPVPGDRFASKSGTHLELGVVNPRVPFTDRVRILNVGSDSATIDVYPADAIPALNGGFGFSAEGQPTHDVGAWIKMAATRLQLPGHSSTVVPFRLVVPTGAGGGEHVGGIVAEPAATGGGGGVQTKTRFAMGVYLTVPGAPTSSPVPTRSPDDGRGGPPTTVTITKLTLHPKGRDICPRVSYANPTGLVIDPRARLTVDSSLGLGSRRVTVDRLGAVLPGASATVTLPCLHGLPPGPDTVRLTLTSPQGTTSQSKDVFVEGWPLFLALLFLLILLVLIAFEMWRRHRARQRELEALRAAVAGPDSAT
ncbi:MAG: hypothetical protein QOC82_2326 [Frankiaceae bacterium]|jgi:hypothetical protein|nr:hypothetical protein [Frankiaceae bacterium]